MNSYLKYLTRNRFYTAIQAVGLIVSLAFVILIGTSIRDQIGIIQDVPHHDELYLVGPNDGNPGGRYHLKESFATLPEITRSAAFVTSTSLLQIQGENHFLKLALMDPELLEMIPLEVKSGSNPPFAGNEGVVITERAARRFFPDRNPVGESVGFVEDPTGGEAVSATITAVIDNPDYTILGDFDFAVNLQSRLCPDATAIREPRRNAIGRIVCFFAQIPAGTQLDALSDRIRSFPDWFLNPGQESVSMLTPYDELYFSPFSIFCFRQGKRMYLSVLVVLVLLLLGSALLSYINLSLAVSGDRAKEMATRRLVGEDRNKVFRRMLAESLLFTLVCYGLAVLLAFWLAPALDSIRPTGLNVPFRLRIDFPFLILSALLVLLVGCLAGTVPAAASAAVRPLDVVSGQLRRKHKMVFSRVCIILQNVLAVVLIVLTLTLSRQLRFLEQADLGADLKEDLYFFKTPLSDLEMLQLMTDRFRTSPLVREIGYTTGYPTCMNTRSAGKGVDLTPITCDSVAFGMMGFRIRERFAQMSGSVFLSQSAANALAISRENATPDNVYWGYERNPANYPGVVGGILEDFRTMPVNASNEFLEGGVPIVEVSPAGVPSRWGSALLLRTTSDHRAFEDWFRPEVNAIHKELIGMPDVFELDEVRGGYVDDLIAADHDDMRRYLRLVGVFCLISILLSLLALVAMSTFYARMNAKEIAVRKVFGGTIGTELWRGVLRYMFWVCLSLVVGIPLSILACERFLQSYAEHITGYGWIFVAAALITLVLSFVSVLWQTLKAAKTNPAEELKKE